VVVGYWARTVKIDVENSASRATREHDSEGARLRQLEDDERKSQLEDDERKRQIEDQERQRKQKIEDDRLTHEWEIERLKLEQEQVQKMAQIEVQKIQNMAEMNQMNRQNNTFEPANKVRVNKKVNRQNDLIELVNIEPNLGPTELTKRLNELGHSASVSTVKRDIKSLNGVINS
jgi:hypothetical protein